MLYSIFLFSFYLLQVLLYTTQCRLKFLLTITSWELDGEAVEIVSDFILGGSKITADGDCSHEIKRCPLGEKLSET